MFYLILAMSRPEYHFLASGGGAFCLLSRLSRAKYSSPISAISLWESNSSHLSDTDVHIDPFMFIRVFSYATLYPAR